MYSNLFKTNNKPLNRLEVSSYSVDSHIPPDLFYKTVKKAEWKLFNKNIISATIGLNLYFIENGSSVPELFEIDRYKFILNEKKHLLYAHQHNNILKKLVECAIKLKIKSIGYTREDDQKFYQEEPYKQDFFSFHKAFYAEVEVFPDGNVGIWLDPALKWIFKLNGFLQWAKINNFEGVHDYLINKSVKYPSVRTYKYYLGKIVGIKDLTLCQYNVNSESLLEYWTQNPEHKRWLKRSNIELNPQESPIILVEIKKSTKPLAYPPQTLNLIIDLNDPLIPDNVFREKMQLPPKRRIEDTYKLFDLLLKGGLWFGKIKFIFLKELFNWNQASSSYGKIIQLNAPDLQFGNRGTRSANYIKNAMFQYGPVTKKSDIKINYIAPESVEQNIHQFHNYLNKHALKLHLGSFEFGNFYPIDRITPDRYMRVCQNIGQEIQNQIVMVILPNKQVTDTYYAAKRGLGRNLLVSQMIQFNTFLNLLEESKKRPYSYANYNIALKAYGRNLECGESIWHLRSPVGGIDPSKNYYFMGFDVSRNPNTKKEAAAYAAVCDNQGRILYRNTIDTHRGEKVQAEVLSDWFYDLAMSTYDEMKDEKSLDGIFLFKDGNIPSSQIEEYKKGSLTAKQRLVKEQIMTQDSDIKIIAVIKQGLHRFYGDEKNKYYVDYSGLIRNELDAILLTSKPRIGTASTTRLSLTYQIIHDMNIENISVIFNDLRYLDWNSLFQQPKTILPLHIVQNLAKLQKEDVIVPYDPR